jgi:hypothetical protein
MGHSQINEALLVLAILFEFPFPLPLTNHRCYTVHDESPLDAGLVVSHDEDLPHEYFRDRVHGVHGFCDGLCICI